MRFIDELMETAEELQGLFNGEEAHCAACGMPGKVGTGMEFFPNVPEAGQLTAVTFETRCADHAHHSAE